MVVRRYLLDTNVLSQPLRPRPNQAILERLAAHRDSVATSAPVLHEMLFGAHRMPRSRKRTAYERYIEESVRRAMPILAYDQAAAEWHARERAR